MPLSIGLLLCLAGMYFLYTKRYKKAKIFLSLGLVWIVLVSSMPVSVSLLTPLENEYTPVKVYEKQYDYIVVLGGDVKGRTYEALRLYHLLHGAKILTSGYAANNLRSDANKTADLLISLGVKAGDIMLQESPKDTKEEAIAIKKRLGTTPFLLVTNATHMGRAMALCKAQGLHPIAAPTNYLANKSKRLLPNGEGLYFTEIALHEYIGRLYYWIKKLVL